MSLRAFGPLRNTSPYYSDLLDENDFKLSWNWTTILSNFI